ncbi:dihydropteroate synthase [Thermaurantiacus tibetensis]|uniref:dihydropteroate synthase n=1 Tax=Thermaurantiacus tibetensis TaxID=2759035 RepID=UPI00188EAAFE|nr:dihydropteroate synthase [Thermaurantiacus tibetensis]
MLPKIMGILNVTPDSFSDGGRHATAAEAVEAGLRMAEAGAAIVDVGGESTRPGAAPVPLGEELRRVMPVVEGLVCRGVPVSIDTRKARVMAEALAAGATMVNDVSALTHDPDSLAVAAASSATIVLMHMQGTPETMQQAPDYADVVAEVRAFLDGRVAACVAAGIPEDRLVRDPGIGFGKTLEHNLALLRNLPALGSPLLLGASRKALIGRLTGADVHSRLPGSLALALHAARMGCAYVRVHDVAETVQALRVWAACNPG